MKKAFRAIAAVAFVVTLFFFVRPAHSYQFVPTGGTSGTTTTTVLLAATTGAIIYFIVRKPDLADGGVPNFNNRTDGGNGGMVMNRDTAAPLALQYLKEQGTQLSSDIAHGGGASVNDLMVALAIAPAHKAAFNNALYQHRDELIDLARTDKLDQGRAARFFERIGDFMATDAELSADYQSLAARS